METRVKQAVDNFLYNGYNCAQAVALAYADLLDADKYEALNALLAFGSGMGSRKGTCGAITGAVYLVGKAIKIEDDAKETLAPLKKLAYQKSAEITNRFHSELNTTICQELKDPKSPTFTPCTKCIEKCAQLVEEIIFPGVFD